MRRTLLLLALVGGVFTLRAQGDQISDEDLTNYAKVMVWAENEKDALGSIVSDSVTIWLENSILTPGRYMEFSKAEKQGALQSVDATQQEFDEYARIQARIDQKAEKFKATYVDRIKNDIGAGPYNQIKSALKSDTEVKSRYDAIYNKVKEESGSDEDTAD